MPRLDAKLLEAVDLALAGDWEGAHRIAQDHEGDGTANWIHAVVHRMEGDLGNARYWYGRCGRKLREEVSTDEELREIRKALEGATRA
jgi:hypothetical protein